MRSRFANRYLWLGLRRSHLDRGSPLQASHSYRESLKRSNESSIFSLQRLRPSLVAQFNEGCILLLYGTPDPTWRVRVSYSSFRRKTSQTLSGGIRLRPACERASLARGTIYGSNQACVEPKHDFVTCLESTALEANTKSKAGNPSGGGSWAYARA